MLISLVKSFILEGVAETPAQSKFFRCCRPMLISLVQMLTLAEAADMPRHLKDFLSCPSYANNHHLNFADFYDF